ncbi:MAG TPA: hypothetical protein VFV33_25460 [Gemmatimonadaceae bacterium]|nr:hypothetical protein [Gemmatimonadaceae bacterium]
MAPRHVVLPLAVLALALSAPEGRAAGELVASANASSATEITIQWQWYESGPTPVDVPEWVGYDILRREPATCSAWTRANAEIIPRVPGVSHSGTFVDTPPAAGVTWEYQMIPVDASHQRVNMSVALCAHPCAFHLWESIPKPAAPITIATPLMDLGWAVGVAPCPEACWSWFMVVEPGASLLRPYVGTGQAFKLYGDEYFSTFEGSLLYLDHFEPALCGATPATRPSWGSVKTLYR